MSRPHHENHGTDRRGRRRFRGAPNGERRPQPIALTEDQVPAATADAPRPSGVVFVSDESRASHPWLPARVIVGSVWCGPQHVRVRVDESGNAVPWR